MTWLESAATEATADISPVADEVPSAVDSSCRNVTSFSFAKPSALHTATAISYAARRAASLERPAASVVTSSGDVAACCTMASALARPRRRAAAEISASSVSLRVPSTTAACAAMVMMISVSVGVMIRVR